MSSYPTLLDMAKRNAWDRAVPLIEETSKWIPEISGMDERGVAIPGVGSVRTIKGINYHTLVRTSNPTVDFRDANEGTNPSTSTYENRLVETFILNPRWEADKAVADRSEDGPDMYLADEAMAIVEASMQRLGTQFFYGRSTTNGGSAKGYPGLVDSVVSSYVLDKSGTNGSCHSVWAVKFGATHVQWVWGENGTLAIPDKRIETVYRSSLPMTAYVQDLLAYPGVQVGSTRSLGRIKGLDGTSGKSLTDAFIFKLLSMMKVRPDVLFTTKTGLEELRSSRTATNPTGAPAPRPTEVDGVPIVATESLLDTE